MSEEIKKHLEAIIAMTDGPEKGKGCFACNKCDEGTCAILGHAEKALSLLKSEDVKEY